MGNKVISDLSNKNLSFYRPEIDGLRAFAIIAVVINHFNEGSKKFSIHTFYCIKITKVFFIIIKR